MKKNNMENLDKKISKRIERNPVLNYIDDSIVILYELISGKEGTDIKKLNDLINSIDALMSPIPEYQKFKETKDNILVRMENNDTSSYKDLVEWLLAVRRLV